MKLLLALLISSLGIANGEQYQSMRDQLSSKISNMIDTRLGQTLYAEKGMQRGYKVEVQKPVQNVKNIVKQKVEQQTYQPYKSQYLSKQEKTPFYNSYTYSKPVEQIITHTSVIPVTQTYTKNWKKTIEPVKTNVISTNYNIPINTESNVQIVTKQIIPSTQTTNYNFQTGLVVNNTNNYAKTIISSNYQYLKKSNPITDLTHSLSVNQYQKQRQYKKQYQQQHQLKKQQQQQQSFIQRVSVPQVIKLREQPTTLISSPTANIIVGSFKDTNHVQGKGNIVGSRSNSLIKEDILDLGLENMFGRDFNKKFAL